MTKEHESPPGSIVDADLHAHRETLPLAADELKRSTDLSVWHSEPPTRLPGYVIERCLGEGAYGSVWFAREQHTGKFVAIKFYTHRRGLDWSLLNREVEKLAVLYTCRSIVGLIHVGWDFDPPYYVMEYLENGSLARLLENGPLQLQEALRMVTVVLQALVHAHGSGILHCDLKPANILLDHDFEPRLADFGQSRLSHEQQPALGTLFYMAPEQADLNAVPDARWDVYALGAVLYETLTGQVPHRSPENEQLIRQTESLEERLRLYAAMLKRGPRPSAHRNVRRIDQALVEIIDRCLETDVEKRFPNAQAVVDALNARRRNIARRPLLTLGIVVPSLLLLGMVPLVSDAMKEIVQSSQKYLTARALESDAVTVKILARSIEHELEDRRAELLVVAEDPRLADAIVKSAGKPWTEREPLKSVLDEWKRRVDQERREEHRELDVSWLLTDQSGIQLYRRGMESDPHAPQSTVDKNFAWRDYFHGQQQDFREGEAPAGIAPLRKPYISRAFQSKVTHQYMVAVSVPVWDPEKKQVLAVLSRTMHLGQLLNSYKPEMHAHAEGEVERTIALVDTRGCELLDHPWMTDERLRELPPDMMQRLRLDPALCRKLSELHEIVAAAHAAHREPITSGEDRDDDYDDPVGTLAPEEYGKKWLAAFWPVGDTGWTAVVQERKTIALMPVERMHASMLQYMHWGVVICCGLVAALWYFIFQALNDRSSGGGQRSSPHSVSPPASPSTVVNSP